MATTELSDHLGVPVQIGRVNIEWFNRLVLEEVSLEDQSGKSLFNADHISAGFEILPLINGKIVFTTVRLFGFTVNLNKETPQSPLNLQFVIDAFASKDTVKKESNIDLRFNSILVRRGNLKFDINSEAETPGKFNPKHIDIQNLSAKISMKAFNKDSLNANIKKLSFEESSGFILDKFAMNIVGNRDSIFVNNFEILLPESNLRISRAHIDISEIKTTDEFLNKANISLIIPPSQLCPRDFAVFIPAFKNFNETIEISADASGVINDINLRQLALKYSDKMLFIGKMDLKGITRPEEAYLFGEVNKMYITTEGLTGLINNFSNKPVILPEPVVKLGTINFSGEISGFFDNLVAFGKFSSNIGSIKTDLIFGKKKAEGIAAYLKGHISTSDLAIQHLFPAGNPYGPTKLDINLDLIRQQNEAFRGNLNADIKTLTFKGYSYENILLSGHFDPKNFKGKIEIDDPNGKLFAEGFYQNKGVKSVFNFLARIDNFKPDSLNLTNKYEDPEISLSLRADLQGNSIDNIQGNIKLDSLAFLTKPDSFYLKQLEINASGQAQNKQLTLSSDIINGEITGSYSFETLIPSFLKTMQSYLPALIPENKSMRKIKENDFSMLLTIENTEALSNTLKLPITMINQGRITAQYNNQYNRFRIEAFIPKFKVGKSMFESGYFSSDNNNGQANLKLRAINYNEKGLRNYIDLNADALDNQINTLIEWSNNKERLFSANISASTHFMKNTEDPKDGLHTEIYLNDSKLILNDSTWNITPTSIEIWDGKINIQDFLIAKADEFLRMYGTVSQNPEDVLYLNLNKVELSYIFDILNIPVLQFAGKATGKFNISDLFGSRILNTDLEVQNFAFNQVELGRLNLFSEWDDMQQGIMMLGSIYKNDSTWTDVNGYIFPVGKNAGLSLYFGANDLNLAFLHPFVDNIAKNMQGRGFGNVHLHGPFSDLNVEGDAYVMDGGLGIEYLNTYYTFSDSVHLREDGIFGKNITVYDKFGNTGKVNLAVNHRHFRDVSFNIDVQSNNMLVFDATQRINPLIFGTVFGTGTASIYGNNKIVNFDINMRSDPKTAITLDFINNSTAADYNFITFVDKKALAEQVLVMGSDSLKKTLLTDNNEGSELRMNFLLDITPDAKIELIMDPVAGDKLTGYCSGSLQIQYGTKTDLRMYGNIGIVNGSYNFSLQQLIHKEFKIRDGSTISFRGDPLEASMNINAIYNVTANIQDLDQSFASESARRNIPVNCVLNLEGLLRNPAISFDLELPGSNEELERQVKSLVDTEDMMTRQIVYLLVLNKFYTPSYTLNPYASNDFSAVASSAISSQISSIMNSFTDKVQLGTNIRTSQDGIEDTEVEMLLSSQLLNNRLLFNGNFGYKNNATQKNAFIGEFDLEYLLTPSGDIRLKAYNHANDMYMFLKQALTTQGVGVMYKKDFTRLSDIFKRRRKQLIAPMRPATTDSISGDKTIKD